MTTDEARRRLIVFFTGLVGEIAKQQHYGDPASLRQYNAAITPKRFAEVAR